MGRSSVQFTAMFFSPLRLRPGGPRFAGLFSSRSLRVALALLIALGLASLSSPSLASLLDATIPLPQVDERVLRDARRRDLALAQRVREHGLSREA